MKTRECRECHNFKTKDHFNKTMWTLPEKHNPKCRVCSRKYRQNGLKAKEGYIYVIKNPAWKDWCKVGLSTNIEARLGTMNTQSPFRDFELFLKIKVSDIHTSEREAHELLKNIGIEKRNEWFKIEVTSLMEILIKEYGNKLI